MIYFPKISNPGYPFKEKLEDNSLRSRFEDGSMQSRKKFTRGRDTFTVTWNNLPGDEYRILKDFIKNTVSYSSKSFYWIYPKFDNRKAEWFTENNNMGDNPIIVRIISVSDVECNSLDYWKITLELQEV